MIYDLLYKRNMEWIIILSQQPQGVMSPMERRLEQLEQEAINNHYKSQSTLSSKYGDKRIICKGASFYPRGYHSEKKRATKYSGNNSSMAKVIEQRRKNRREQNRLYSTPHLNYKPVKEGR